jgi:hypothetical protein
MCGSAEALQAATDESAEALLKLGTALTVGAKAEMAVEVLLFSFSKRAVEEEIDDASYIIAKHQSVSSLFSDDIHGPATSGPWIEFLDRFTRRRGEEKRQVRM